MKIASNRIYSCKTYFSQEKLLSLSVSMPPTSQTMDWVTQKNRKEKVVEMMRNGEWRGVIKEFHGDDKYREPLLVWIRPTLHCLEFIRNSAYVSFDPY